MPPTASAPETYCSNFKCAILQLMIDILNISNEIDPKWIPQNFTDDKSVFV